MNSISFEYPIDRDEIASGANRVPPQSDSYYRKVDNREKASL